MEAIGELNAMKMIGMALIGCGRAGMIHARNFASRVPGARVAAVADVNAEAAERAAAECGGIFHTTDFKQAVNRLDVNGVIVAAPTGFHRDIAVEAAGAGKHILCEKPMASIRQECAEMAAAAQANGVKLQIGFMRRFDESFRRAKEYVDSGAIGDVVMVKSHTRGPSAPHEWMFDISKSNGPLAEVCSHDIDTLRWFTGSEAASVYAAAGNYRCPQAKDRWLDFYDTVLLSVRMKNGMIGWVEGAQGVGYGYDARVDILGTSGCIQIGSLQDKNVLLFSQKTGMVGDIVSSWTNLFHDAYIREDISFAEAIRADSETITTGLDGLRAVEIVNAGNESIVGGKIVLLEGGCL
jgi:myo-inositol 2-dehydrogenase/D-chiro-inositol 1-dehydrogenase/scyllo-inositol 2-dehydrogenase (NAD+)